MKAQTLHSYFPHYLQASLMPVVCGPHFEKRSLVLVLHSYTSFTPRKIWTVLAILARHKPMRSVQMANSIVACLVCWGGFVVCYCQFGFLIVAYNWCPINVCLCWTKSLFFFCFTINGQVFHWITALYYLFWAISHCLHTISQGYSIVFHPIPLKSPIWKSTTLRRPCNLLSKIRLCW